MAEKDDMSVSHDHAAFLQQASERPGFEEAQGDLEEEYALARELLSARAQAGLTQEEVAESMGTTRSAVSRLEGTGKHSPSSLAIASWPCASMFMFVPPGSSPGVFLQGIRQPLRGVRHST